MMIIAAIFYQIRQRINNNYVYSNELSYLGLFTRIFRLNEIESELHAWILSYIDIMKPNVVPMLDRLKVINPRRYGIAPFRCYI